MGKYPPLYRYSLKEAVAWQEKDKWRKSYEENVACAIGIQKAIADNYDGERLDSNCAKELILKYGFDRVNWVLAATVLEKNHDGRISPENKAWARKHYIPEDKQRMDFCVEAHPGLTDILVSSVRKEWDALGLYDYSHCVSEKDGQLDYTGKLLVVKGENLTDDYRKPDCQLFYAVSGFGCRPNARGSKVYGRFLSDNEETYMLRSEIAGILKDELVPDWARLRVEELSNSQMTMEGM